MNIDKHAGIIAKYPTPNLGLGDVINQKVKKKTKMTRM